MFLKNCFIRLLITSVVISNIAVAEDKKSESPYYARIDAGLSWPVEKLPSGDTYYNQRLLRSELYGLGVGYTFNQNIRSDLTFTARTNYKFTFNGTYDGEETSANQKIKSNTLMLNTYYNFPHDIFTPYINAGIGISKLYTGNYSSNYNSGEFIYSIGSNSYYNLAWNIGIGAQTKLTNNFTLDTFFRYIDLGKTKTQFKRDSIHNVLYTVSPFLMQSYETGVSLIYRF